MQEYYEVLGLTEDASDEEINATYCKLKEKYGDERFLEGEKGNEAAKKLTKLEEAYREIREERDNKVSSGSNKTENFSKVEKLIKSGDLTGAQELLDDVTDRSAEWHYLQSVIYYKKTWMNESKKQLEIAMSMEPNNTKYSDSYTKLKQKMEFSEKQFHSGSVNENAQNNGHNKQMGESGVNECLSFCTTWCCMEMLCSMCCR